MPGFVYGDSYGDVANRELAMDSARDQRFFQSLAARRAFDQALAQRQQEDFRNQLGILSMLAQQRQNSESLNFNRATRAEDTQRDFLKSLLQNKQFYDSLASNERVAGLRLGGTAARDADREADRDYSEASGLAEQGTPLTELSKMFKLTPEQTARLTARIAQAAKQETADLAPSEAIQSASLPFIQGLITEARRKAAEKAALEKFTPFTLDSTLKKQVAEMPADKLPRLDDAAFRTLIENNLFKQKLDTLLRADPATQTVSPIPLPRRFQASNPSAMVAPPSPPAVRAAAGGPTNLAMQAVMEQAADAIRRGADPAAVKARLVALGLQPQ